MSLDDYRGLALKISKAASDYEREYIIKEYSEAYLDEKKPDIVEEVVEDIKSGISVEADEIKEAILEDHEDEWREEIEDKLKKQYSEKKIAWVIVRDKILKQSVNNTIQTLLTLSEILHQSNSIGSSDELLTPMQREMLIAALKTMIVELQAPCIDRGRAENLLVWFKNIGKKTAEEKVKSGLSTGIEDASNALGHLLKNVSGSETTGIF